MRAPWLFALLFLAYLPGPVRAPAAAGRADPPVVHSFAALVRTVYPHADPVDRALWSSRLAGATLTALAGALTFLALLRLTTPGRALVLALLAAFPSPLWSWASRSDAPQAPAALAVAALLWLAVLGPRPRTHAQRGIDLATGILLGALLALDSPFVLAPLALVVLVRTSAWTHSAASATGLGTVLGLVAAALVGSDPHLLLRAPRWTSFDLSTFAAYLISPGRGLLVFVPLAVMAALSILPREGRRRLPVGCVVVALVAAGEAACADPATVPLAFGPVLLSPFVPVLALAAAASSDALLRWGALASVPIAALHGAAVLLGGHTWEERVDAPANPAVLWSVGDSPYRDLVLGPTPPDPSTLRPAPFLMAPGPHLARAGEPLPWLHFGWERPEATGTWAQGPESWIVIAVPPGDYVLTLMATAPRVQGRPQRVAIECPGEAPFEVTFAEGLWNLQPLSIPFTPQTGVTAIKLRPAHLWRPGHGDVRRLSLFVASFWLERGAGR